jgi:uncharacterized protein
MHCFVYKSTQKVDHFLYLPAELDNTNPDEQIPAALLQMLGTVSFVVDFDLLETRKLPNADAKQIITALEERGFYFQMPNKSLHYDEERYFN